MDAPEPVIKIWKSTTVYYEVEDVVTLPVIDRQENRAGSFSFGVTYDATDDTILDSTFDGWSDSSTGAVDWGLRVTIDNVANSVTTRVAEGIITTITPTENLLSFECADMLAVLGAKGAELHRNYYNSATYTGRFDAISGGSEGNTTVAVDISAITNAQGTPIDPIYYYASSVTSWATNDRWEVAYYDNASSETYRTVSWKFTTTKYWDMVTIAFQFAQASALAVTFRIKDSNGTAVYTSAGNVIYSTSPTKVLTSASKLAPGTYTVEVEATNIIYFGSVTQWSIYVSTYEGTSSDGELWRDGSLLGYGSMGPIREFEDKLVTAWSRNGNTLLITGITGVTINASTKPDLISPASGRASVPYTSGTITVTEIMEHIKKVALGDDVSAVVDSSAFGSAPTLSLFRTGGGYALDYLRKLADIATSSGIQLAFCLDNNTLRIGARRKPTDTVSYSVTEGSLTGPLYLLSVSLLKSMKGRPSRAMLRGSLSSKTDNKPIMAVLRNGSLASRRNGILTDTVITNSSALTASDMIAEAFAQVNDSGEDWEGSIELSGIVPDLFDLSGAYAGSGKVIEITADHHGLSAKKFKVTAVKLDYTKLITTVTLTNAKQIYSSDVVESIAEALTVGDMTVSASGSDLYKTQFCYQYSSVAETTQASSNTVKIKTSDNVEYTLGDVAVYVLPNGRKLIYGAVTISGSTSSVKYRVQYYQVNGGSWRTIQERDRCDAYNGQYVILNVDCPQS